MESGLAVVTFVRKYSLLLSGSFNLSFSFLLNKFPMIKQLYRRFQFVSLVFIWGLETVSVTINMGSREPCTNMVHKLFLHWDSDRA